MSAEQRDVQVIDVFLHGRQGNNLLFSDFLVREIITDQMKDFKFAISEWIVQTSVRIGNIHGELWREIDRSRIKPNVVVLSINMLP